MMFLSEAAIFGQNQASPLAALKRTMGSDCRCAAQSRFMH
jgi:hypothetical protein